MNGVTIAYLLVSKGIRHDMNRQVTAVSINLVVILVRPKMN